MNFNVSTDARNAKTVMVFNDMKYSVFLVGLHSIRYNGSKLKNPDISQGLSQGISKISGSMWYHDLLINYNMVTEDIVRSVWTIPYGPSHIK